MDREASVSLSVKLFGGLGKKSTVNSFSSQEGAFHVRIFFMGGLKRKATFCRDEKTALPGKNDQVIIKKVPFRSNL